MQARGKWWIVLLLIATLGVVGGCGRTYSADKEKAAKKKAADRKKMVHEHLIKQQREMVEKTSRPAPPSSKSSAKPSSR